MITQIRNKVRELLDSKRVELVIGYRRASDGISAAPAFIANREETEALVWDAYCVYNLAGYLKDFPQKKIGIIAKPCDIRAIVVLLQENQLKRQDLFIIGLECSGVISQKAAIGNKESQDAASFDRKCKICRSSVPPLYDFLVKDPKALKLEQEAEDEYGSIRKMEAKSAQERLKFWQEEFARCIRCYACRQVCPMCYCSRCVADQASPAWFSKAGSLTGNFSWNVTRAMHLAGRCIDCGECERACPVGIPLRDINKKIKKDVKELFNYEAGVSTEEKPVLSRFDKNDPDDFIR